jgi:hypothetical protein
MKQQDYHQFFDLATSIMKKYLFLFYLLLLQTITIQAQTGSIWRMGTNINNQKEFNFNTPNTLYSQNCAAGCNSPEGNSTMDDGNGNVLLQSNGIKVWDGNWNLLTNGDSIGYGGSASNGCLILPHPGNSNLYYVFTVDAGQNTFQDTTARGLQYAIADMTLNGGLGAVISKNNLLTDSIYEKMSCTRHCNGVDWWIVVHKWGTNSYYSYKLTSNGIDTVPVVSHAGAVLSDTFAGYPISFSFRGGSLRISPNGTILGNTCIGHAATTQGKHMQLFSYNNQTGIVGPRMFLDSIGNGIEDSFCFSPNGKKLYRPAAAVAVGNVWGNNLVQYDLSSNDSAQIAASEKGLLSDTNSFFFEGGIQIGIDGKLYVSTGNTTRYISVIDNPDADSADIVMHLNQIPIGYSTFHNFTQFPDCIFARKHQGVLRTRKCSYGLENETIILDTLLNVVHEFLWDFGDPASGVNNTSTERNPYHEFTAPGTYTITLTLQNACNQFTIIQQFMYDFVTVDAGTDQTLCAGDSAILNANATGGLNNFIWQPSNLLSDSTSSSPIAFPSSNSLFIATQQPSGCVDTVLVQVNQTSTPVINPVGINLGCTTASSYQWYVNGQAIIGATQQEHFPSQIGNYTVVTTDANACTAQSVAYNVAVVGLNNQSSTVLIIYPNPAKDALYIKTKNNYKTYIIYNVLGAIIQSGVYSNSINIAAIAKGSYLLSLQGPEGNVQKMWVKE